MLQFRQILQFSVIALILSALLLSPWSVVERGYARAFQAANSAFFSQFWFWSAGQAAFIDLRAKDLVKRIDDVTPGDLKNSNFRPIPPTDVLDTLVVIMNRNTPGPFGQFRIGSRQLGYWPAAWMLALIIAKPLILRRKLWALFFGMLLVHGFIAFRVSIKLLEGGLAVPGKKYALFQASPFGLDILKRMNQIFVEDPTISFVIPTLIWFLVAFTREDWAAVRQLASRGDDEPEANA